MGGGEFVRDTITKEFFISKEKKVSFLGKNSIQIKLVKSYLNQRNNLYLNSWNAKTHFIADEGQGETFIFSIIDRI